MTCSLSTLLQSAQRCMTEPESFREPEYTLSALQLEPWPQSACTLLLHFVSARGSDTGLAHQLLTYSENPAGTEHTSIAALPTSTEAWAPRLR